MTFSLYIRSSLKVFIILKFFTGRNQNELGVRVFIKVVGPNCRTTENLSKVIGFVHILRETRLESTTRIYFRDRIKKEEKQKTDFVITHSNHQQ